MRWNEIAFRKSLQCHSQPVGKCDEKLPGQKSTELSLTACWLWDWGCWDCLVENYSSVTYLLKYNETTEVNQCNFTHTLLVRIKCDEMTWQKVTSVTHKLLVMQLKCHESAMHKITTVLLTSWWSLDGVWEFPAENHYSVTHSLLIME